jgi:hypothetical protein
MIEIELLKVRWLEVFVVLWVRMAVQKRRKIYFTNCAIIKLKLNRKVRDVVGLLNK